jgi:hypothetical protein
MNVPRPEEPKGRILPFRPRGKPRAQPSGPVEGLEKYAESSEADDYRRRMINNMLAFAACLVLVAAGVWLADRIAEMRKNQDCVLSGRRNCANVSIPPAGPRLP